ncbi:uncharacterized protein BJ171DRAFT_577562 [Polychytrium aggregatum]|uniref:uncharacterized protein n=1 Tax=Polychytrium aggregatum TaxID=110093 RepID=UPI0022FEE243|nr:uncharacterized protein BJ171DRAFT_577562 [Polychytrium aggregatum]KAI9208462.1 hypothetical protein BJ171DRAFT_577562 [Polychytrium aggregatum]
MSGSYRPLQDDPSASGIGPSAASASVTVEGFGSYSSSFTGFPPSGLDQAERVNKYETQLPIRLDIEAALCYFLGAFTGVALLILETKNDYVRFHAWQSCLLFTPYFILQFVFSFVSSSLSWLLFFAEIGLIAWLGYKAAIGADNLERYQLPFIGPIAYQWVEFE